MWTNFHNSFTRWFVRKFSNSLCTHHRDFHLTCNMLLHYLVKVKNPKCYRLWQHLNRVLTYSCEHFDWLTFWSCQKTSQINSWTLFNWTLLHYGDFFTMIIFGPSSFFLGYTSYVVHILVLLRWSTSQSRLFPTSCNIKIAMFVIGFLTEELGTDTSAWCCSTTTQVNTSISQCQCHCRSSHPGC